MVASISSLVMAIITFFALIQNNKSLNQLKKQWDEEHRPIIEFSIVFKEGFTLLKVCNSGNKSAKQVKFSFNTFLKGHLIYQGFSKFYRDLEKRNISIEAKCSKYFFIAPIKGKEMYIDHEKKICIKKDKIAQWYEKHLNDTIHISCTYNGKYKYSDNLKLSDYMCGDVVIIDDEISAIHSIKTSINEQNKILQEITNKHNKI